MRHCLHCQAELPASAQFCNKCGTPVEDDPSPLAQPGEMTDIANEQQEDAPQDEQSSLLETAPRLPVTPAEQETADIAQEADTPAEADAPDEAEVPDEAAAQPEGDPEPVLQPATIQQADAPETPDQFPTAPEIQIPEPQDLPVYEQEPATVQQTPAALDEVVTPLPRDPLEENYTPAPARQGRGGRGRALIIVLLIVLIVIAGGAGAVIFMRGQTQAGGTSPGSSQCANQQAGCANSVPNSNGKDATQLSFSGAASGLMKINAMPRCQRAAVANLSTLTVTLTGVVGGQTYNFGFVIEHYNGPGAYSSATTSTTVLFDVPGQSTTNGWGNNSPADSGTITVARGEQAGNISYLLHGFGTQSGTQVQVSGNWACA